MVKLGMVTIAKTAKISRALKVIQHTNEGMTVIDACQEVGIPRSSYYYIIKNNPESFAEYQQLVREEALQQLFMLAASQTRIIETLIRDALSEDIKVKDRLAITKELDRQMKKMQETLGINFEVSNNHEISRLLKEGPIKSLQLSKISNN